MDITQTGIVVTTSLKAGLDGLTQNHAEGIAVSTAIVAGIGFGERDQHAEGIVVSTAVTAGLDGSNLNHGEGIVVSTAIVAGIGFEPGERNQHAEGLVLR